MRGPGVRRIAAPFVLAALMAHPAGTHARPTKPTNGSIQSALERAEKLQKKATRVLAKPRTAKTWLIPRLEAVLYLNLAVELRSKAAQDRYKLGLDGNSDVDNLPSIREIHISVRELHHEIAQHLLNLSETAERHQLPKTKERLVSLATKHGDASIDRDRARRNLRFTNEAHQVTLEATRDTNDAMGKSESRRRNEQLDGSLIREKLR